ncbi:MAG: PepSY-like domain-containing protein [Candidatus Homeothermus sp.]|nr:PepSY-like domain-containing protein [Candidatus Homeothermus sp.]
MKKIFGFLPLLLISVMCIAVTACSDDDDAAVIGKNELPAAVTSFVSTYFPSQEINVSQKDNDGYEVMLSDGTMIDFNLSGEWVDVDAPVGKTIPSGFYPAAIDSYIAANVNGTGINEISKEPVGYDVELVSGVELIFDTDGGFIGYDRD